MRIIVTGGAGFIGSALVKYLLNIPGVNVLNIDALTYAGTLASLGNISHNPNYEFRKVDICDKNTLMKIFHSFKPSKIMHLAAETHVDRSIDNPEIFIQSNVVGTFSVLEAARDYWMNLSQAEQNDFRFLHVSTDEVFGSLGNTGKFTETTAYSPNSPYSASKAASDHLVRAWHHTYRLPVLITNCSNNYGPYQFPEKLIPLMVVNCLDDKPLPIYGTGENVRDWLYVDDHASALWTVLNKGRLGETYNIGGETELSNIEVVQTICDIIDELNIFDSSRRKLISFVSDRPGHDNRYAMDISKISTELGWKPSETFQTGLRKTVLWYVENQDWLLTCDRD